MKIAYSFIALALLSGCGGQGDGPRRYPVSGEVIFEGKPVPVGTIIFSPDRSKNHQGPGVSVDFRDGKYSVDRQSGVTAGPHTVTIFGFDGKVPPGSVSAADVGNELFPAYETKHEFPAEESSATFQISTAKK